MFRETDGQASMFEAQHIMPAAKRKRLKKTWAHWIHEHLLSAIDEEPFFYRWSTPIPGPSLYTWSTPIPDTYPGHGQEEGGLRRW